MKSTATTMLLAAAVLASAAGAAAADMNPFYVEDPQAVVRFKE